MNRHIPSLIAAIVGIGLYSMAGYGVGSMAFAVQAASADSVIDSGTLSVSVGYSVTGCSLSGTGPDASGLSTYKSAIESPEPASGIFDCIVAGVPAGDSLNIGSVTGVNYATYGPFYSGAYPGVNCGSADGVPVLGCIPGDWAFGDFTPSGIEPVPPVVIAFTITRPADDSNCNCPS